MGSHEIYFSSYMNKDDQISWFLDGVLYAAQQSGNHIRREKIFIPIHPMRLPQGFLLSSVFFLLFLAPLLRLSKGMQTNVAFCTLLKNLEDYRSIFQFALHSPCVEIQKPNNLPKRPAKLQLPCPASAMFLVARTGHGDFSWCHRCVNHMNTASTWPHGCGQEINPVHFLQCATVSPLRPADARQPFLPGELGQ